MIKRVFTLASVLCVFFLGFTSCDDDDANFPELQSFNGELNLVISALEDGVSLQNIPVELKYDKDAYYELTFPNFQLPLEGIEVKMPVYLRDVLDDKNELRLKGAAGITYIEPITLPVDATVTGDSIHLTMSTTLLNGLSINLVYKGERK